MQVFKLKKSWKGIKRSLDDTGVEMFIRLFRAQPRLQDLFPKFKGKDLDELRVDVELELHAGAVMAVLDEMVQGIDNVDATMDLVRQTVSTHAKIKDFAPSMYEELEVPFLEAVKITLGDRYSDNMDAIYKVTIHYLLETLCKTHSGAS
ncbi:globin CTT-W-like [Babylonia areolata]|uniref:globin CTT-W-like n=1 Tax=Babylonia areolata TaxID=304850 RepID=UPI003FD352A9